MSDNVKNRKWLVLWILIMVFLILFHLIPALSISKQYKHYNKIMSLSAGQSLEYPIERANTVFEIKEISTLSFGTSNPCNFTIVFLNNGNSLNRDITIELENSTCFVKLFYDDDPYLKQTDAVQITNSRSTTQDITITLSLFTHYTWTFIWSEEFLMILSYYIMVWKSGSKGKLVDEKNNFYGIINFFSLILQIGLIMLFSFLNFFLSLVRID